MAGGEELFEQNGDFYTVGCGEGVELEGVLADGQFALVGGAGNRAVDVGEASAAGFGPGPGFFSS